MALARAGDGLAEIRDRLVKVHGVDPAIFDNPPPRPPNRETAEEAAQRRWRAGEARRRRWESRVPVLFQDASLDRLDDEQQPEKVRGFLAGKAQTLFLAGEVGTGKTFAAYAVGWSAVQHGMTVEAWSTPTLMSTLRPGPEAEPTWEAVLGADLLVLDDLGAVKVSDWAAETMYRLADERVNAGRRQVITTNQSFDDLVALWGQPTMDRWAYRCAAVTYRGESRRARPF